MPVSELQLVRADRAVPRFGLLIREAAKSIGLSEGAFRELLPSITEQNPNKPLVSKRPENAEKPKKQAVSQRTTKPPRWTILDSNQ